MWEWLQKLPEWFQIVFTSSLTVIGLYVILLFIKKGVKIGKGVLVVGSDKKKRSPHAGCPHSKDIVVMINETVKVIARKAEVENVDMLRQQMNAAEEAGDRMLGLLQRIYLRLLEEREIADMTSSPSFKVYQLVLYVLRYEMLNFVRYQFRENHYDKMTEGEFGRYVEQKADLIVARATEFINRYYCYPVDVDREAVYKANIAKVGEFEEEIRGVFSRARAISVECRRELDNLDLRLETILKECMGE